MITNIIRLIRIKQWTKGMFIFLPLFFGGELLHFDVLLATFITFVAFSFTSSSIYCFNDILDIDADKQHPEKCRRPIASGAISKNVAYAVMIVCLLISMTMLYFTGEVGDAHYELMGLILLYYLINIAYCVKLKHHAIIDVVIIAIGFVLRVWIGGVAANIVLSEWIIIMTFLLTLFLAFAKRRDDVILYESTGVSHRKNTQYYNLTFLNQVITVIGTITIVAYIMYTLSPDVMERFNSRYIYTTAIFVLMGIVRYLQVTIVYKNSGSPEKILLRDRFIQCCIAGWIVLFGVTIYL